MSETTVTDTASDATEAPESTEETPEELPPLGELEQILVNSLTEKINERNNKAETLSAIGGDPQALLEKLRETSDDPAVVKLNSDIDKLNDALWQAEQKRDELLKPIVDKIREDSKDQVEQLQAAADELDKVIRAGLTYLKSTVGDSIVKYLPEVKRRANRSTPGGTGSDQRRVRGFDIYVNGVLSKMRDGKGVERSNFASAAKEAGVSTKTLQEGFFKIAGGDPKSFPETVEFDVTNPKDNQSYHIKAVRVSAEATPQPNES